MNILKKSATIDDPQYHFKVKIPWYQNYIINLKKRLLKFRFSFTRRFLLSPLFWANIWVLIFGMVLTFLILSKTDNQNFSVFLFAGPFAFSKYEFAIINIKQIIEIEIILIFFNVILHWGAFNTAKNASPFMINTILGSVFIMNLVFFVELYRQFKLLGLVG